MTVKRRLKLLAVMVAAITMLTATACDKDDTQANPDDTQTSSSYAGDSVSADITPAPADSSDPAEVPNEPDDTPSEESSEESSAAAVDPASIVTQTKPAVGFSADAVKNGEISVNGTILRPGISVNEFNKILDDAPNLCTYLEEEDGKAKFDKLMATDRAQGSFSSPNNRFYPGDGTKAWYNAVMMYGYQNPTDEMKKHGECTVRSFEINQIDGTENVEVILPNGWYLGGALNAKDATDMLGTKLETKSNNGIFTHRYSVVTDGMAVNMSIRVNGEGLIHSIVVEYTGT